MIYETFSHMKKLLGHVDTWLEKTAEYARKKPFDGDTLLVARLAPDQFAFARQVQVTCDTLKFAAARLTGKEAPKHPDDETTLEALRGRVKSVSGWLDGLTAADFAGAEKRVVTNPRWEGKVMSGEDYFQEHALPNFYFHLVHSYAILRHNGVDLGKRDFLGTLSLRAP
jgi:hypothetical protein